MQIKTIDPLLRQYPKLSCSLQIGVDEDYYEKVERQITLKAIGLNVKTAELEFTAMNEMELITKRIIIIQSDFLTAFKGVLKPSDYSLVLFQFFLNFIENKVKLYRTNSPEDKIFESKWDDFRREIAHLRYDRDKNLYLRVENFLNYLNQKLSSIDQFTDSTAQEKGIWNKWKQIFETPDVLEFGVWDIALRVNRTSQINPSFKFIYLSPPEMGQASNRLIKRLSNDIPWLFEEIKSTLNPLILIKQHRIFNQSQYLLGCLDEKQKYFSFEFEQFYFDNLTKNNSNNFKKCNELYKSVREFSSDGFFGDASEQLKFIELICEYIETHEKSRRYRSPEYCYDLNDYFDAQLGEVTLVNNNGMFEEKVTLDELKTYIECLRAVQKCHVLIDTYLSAPMSNLMTITQAFTSWGMKDSNFEYLKVYDQPLKSVEELAREIEGPSPQKEKKGRKKLQQSQKREIPAPVKKEPPAKVIPKTSSQVSCPLPLISQTKLPTKSIQITSNGTTELSCSLRNLMRSKENPFILHEYPRAALRQALMYADDLQLIQHNLNNKKGFDPNKRLGSTVDVISASYYQMEQMLRYLILTRQNSFDSTFSCDKHNLKALIKMLPEGTLGDPRVATELFLGNYWTAYPFEQHASWNDLFQNLGREMPKPLSELHFAAVNSQHSNYLQSLQNYAEKTAAFSKDISAKYFNAPDLSGKIPDQEILIFENNPQFNLERVGRCIQCCDKALDQLSSRPHHPAVNILKQASYAFKILSGIQDKINTGPLGSDELSYLVRGTIYWQNQILESLLRAILQIQSRSDIAEHDLAQGYQEIKWKQGANPYTLSMLQKAWAGMNKFSRYPFEVSQAINETHQLILKAELLRERPEFGAGFQEVTQEKCFASLMNFIEVAPVGLKAEEILKELSVLCEGAFVFIEEQALPQIESDLLTF